MVHGEAKTWSWASLFRMTVHCFWSTSDTAMSCTTSTARRTLFGPHLPCNCFAFGTCRAWKVSCTTPISMFCLMARYYGDHGEANRVDSGSSQKAFRDSAVRLLSRPMIIYARHARVQCTPTFVFDIFAWSPFSQKLESRPRTIISMLLLRLSLVALFLRAHIGGLATTIPHARRQHERWLLVVFDDGKGNSYQVSVQANTAGVQINNSMVVSEVSLDSGPITACTSYGVNGSKQDVTGGVRGSPTKQAAGCLEYY